MFRTTVLNKLELSMLVRMKNKGAGLWNGVRSIKSSEVVEIRFRFLCFKTRRTEIKAEHDRTGLDWLLWLKSYILIEQGRLLDQTPFAAVSSVRQERFVCRVQDTLHSMQFGDIALKFGTAGPQSNGGAAQYS
jgi:hypothetical protein